MPDRFYRRRWGIQVITGRGADTENRAVGGVRMVFQVQKDRSQNPDQAKVTLYNLADTTVQALATKDATVRVLAGYRNENARPERDLGVQMMRGTLAKNSLVDGKVRPTRTTAFTVKGGSAFRLQSSVNRIWSRRVFATDVLKTVLREAGYRDNYVTPNTDIEYTTGFAAVGWLTEVVTQVANDLGCSFSMIGDVPHVWPFGELRPNRRTILVSAESGMVGTPTRTDKGIEVSTLLRPGLEVGDLVTIDSRRRHLNGEAIVDAIQHIGDSHAQAWYSNLVLTPR